MKKKTSKKGIRNARLLLAAYWGYKILNGKSALRTSLEVLDIEHRSAKKARQESLALEQTKSQGSARKVSKAPTRSASLLKTVGKPFLKKAAVEILKSARVF